MPTGYTADLHDGKQITFEQFVLKCSRAMGAAITQRDESPEMEIRELTLDDHYVETVAKSAARLQEAISRPASEWEALQDAAIAEAETYRAKYLADQEAMRARYEGMLDQVRAWVPPTSEHYGLKKFMIDQITSSIEFDCGSYVPAVPERTSPDIYAQQEIARLTKAHGRDIQHLAEERERVAGQNAWVRALRDALTP
jgi:hypothetical protein